MEDFLEEEAAEESKRPKKDRKDKNK